MMVTRGYMLRVVLLTVILMVTSKIVSGEILTVNFINYTNPTGLCAECQKPLNTSYPTETMPVCCDELPFKSGNCDNTGEERCDTRFRWTIRPFGASLETRPGMGYNFTDCTMSPSTCPFSEMSTTFGQGPAALLGVTDNPLLSNLTIVWTGRIQFFIEALDSGLPNVIDSLLIDLDNLQLGADFTEEMMFTGFHNISHMTMSFRVECSPGFCGPDCTTTPQNNTRVATCQTNGSLTCTDNRLDSSPLVACNDCLYNLDITTGCSTCIQNYDPVTNCTACLPGYDIDQRCSTCINTNHDPDTNCSTCIIGTRYDPSTNCASCVDTTFNPSDGCISCLLEFYDTETNCTQCLPIRDPSTNCTQCLPGWDISSDCAVCLLGRNISTRCTTCMSGFTGSNCEPASAVDAGLVAGGVGGVLFLVIIVLVIIVCVLVCQVRRRGHVKFISDERAAHNTYDDPGTGTGSSAEHKFQNPIYGPGLEMDCNTGTGSSDDHAFTNSLYETSNVHTEDQLRHPSVSPPSHTVKTGTQDLTSTLDGPMYDTASCHDDSQPREGTPVYDTADRTHHPPLTNPQDEDYSKLRQPPNPQNEDYSKLRQPPNPQDEDYSKLRQPPNPQDEEYSKLRQPPNPQNEDYSKLRQPPNPHYSKLRQPPNPQDEDYSKLRQPPNPQDEDYSKLRQPPNPQNEDDSKLRQPPNPQDEDYSKLRQPPVTSVTPQTASLPTYDTATFTEQPVYDEAFPPPEDSLSKKGTRHPSKSAGAYEEIEDEDICGRDEYDTTYPPPAVIPSVNAYSKLGKLEAELPAYDVANNHHPKRVQPKAPPPNGSLYDTANYPQEQATRPKHNYTETSEFLPTSIKEKTSQHTYDYADANKFLSASSSAKHSYDYVDNLIDDTNALPPALAPLSSSVYTNTTPGKITLEAESRYDLGQ